MNVYVFMHALRNTHMHKYIFAHVHPCMCACTRVCMDTCRSIENMMRMHAFIGYVGNDLIMHGLLQRKHIYIFRTMIAATIIATFYMQKLTAIYMYIYSCKHTHFLQVIQHKRNGMHNNICTSMGATQHHSRRYTYSYLRDAFFSPHKVFLMLFDTKKH